MAQSTKQAIIDEFFRLLDEKPADKITVSELCNRTNISRNTFYYHFTDMHALFDELIEQAEESLLSYCGSIEDAVQGMREMGALARKHSGAVRRIWESDFRDSVLPRLHDTIERLMLQLVISKSADSPIPDEDARLIAYILACLIDGVMYDCVNSDRDFGEIIERCSMLLKGTIDVAIANARSLAAD